jgi:hypothetical protein
MKNSIIQRLGLALLATLLCVSASAASQPGEVDFGKLGQPDKGGKYIEVNVGRNLLSLAAKLIDKQQPEAAKLLRSVQLVRVNVIGLSDDNRDDIQKRVGNIHTQLGQASWDRIVTVQEGNKTEEVSVFVKARGDEALEGLVVTVVDPNGKEAVLVNVVGDIKPEQIAELGEALNINPLKEIGKQMKH